MRDSLFIDTSFVIALVDARDAHHAKASRWMREIRRLRPPRFVSTAIFVELGDGFCDPDAWARVRPIIDGYRQDASVSVIDANAECFELAYALKNARRDKAWGLTDCTSFVIMERYGIKAALTADQHFVQAGFRALLLE